MTLTVRCPAKVNLFLAVGPPDPTGYHPVRTRLQAVGLYDMLTLSTDTGATRIGSNWPDLPQENTLSKVLRLVGEAITLPPLDLHLEKRIPSGSGLGGGSSDAAGLLRALADLLPGKLDGRLLHDVAVAIGVDTPFFLIGGLAKGEGYGELLTPLNDPPQQWLVVAMPDVPSPTAAAYVSLDRHERPFREFPGDDTLHNDFLAVAPQASRDLIDRLIELGARDACLTGSGSAVFGRFSDREASEDAADRLSGCRAWAVPTLARPLDPVMVAV